MGEIMLARCHLISAFSAFLGLVFLGLDCRAEVSVPNIFSDHMVLQQGQQNKVWGRADAGEEVAVAIADQKHDVVADDHGNWEVKLDTMKAGGPHELVISCPHSKTVIADVLVGEVWICSGQSNMEWPVRATNDPDLVKAAANHPQIRMINYPNKGVQSPIWTHEKSQWMECSPETVGEFSAVGYFFGRQLQQTIDVPIGLIHNAWGGSAAEAWIDRQHLQDDPLFQGTLDTWKKREARYEELTSKSAPSEEEQAEIKKLKPLIDGNARPGNIYNGVLKSHLGYGMKGVVWYQGESNANRSYQYRDLFPKLISFWRSEWNQGDFPFYWVQLADFMAEKDEPTESAWAELREAQTMTMDKLPNTGEAVIIDVGEGKDIHPRNKLTVGQRLARWALANQYGVDVAYRSPRSSRWKQRIAA